MKVLVSMGVGVSFEGLNQGQVDRLRSVSEELEIVVAPTDQEMEPHLAGAEIILGRFSKPIFEKAKKLKVVMVEGAGVDNLLFPEFVKSGVTLVSAKGTVGTHLADHSWALFLALLRGVGKSVRAKSWDLRRQIREESWELGGRTLGVVGLGGTGTECARRAQGFDMRVIAVDPEDVRKPPFVQELWKTDRFYDLLAQSDVVMNCTPLTKQTRGMYNLEAFSRMQRHAYFINVTRGPIVDEAGILQALRQGLIAGAGLDVTPTEPLPPGHPLWDMPNAIITPHASGGSPLRLDRWVDVCCANLRRYLDGRPLVGVIDKEKGY
ncbi:MAG: D-2-hydroxyacid dehydrogenase [Chloroflexi bacterium]|nr:D-2-hydroxyacid dehydrogenase [Chloroflexota bacterium]